MRLRRGQAAFAAALVLWLVLVVGRALTREPYVDEAWYALPAWNLATNGSTGSPVIEPVGSPMPAMSISLEGIRQHTFWVMPVPTVAQAAWYRIAGFRLLNLRLFTIFWAAAMLWAWYVILARISGDVAMARFGVVLISMDRFLLDRAALGRMDLMSAACVAWAIAGYLALRDRNLARAVVAAQALVVLAGLSHPNGGLTGFVAVAALIVWLDRRRLRWRHAFLALIPYAVGAGVMAFFVLQDPAAFRAQFFSQASGRLDGALSLAGALVQEARRYAAGFGIEGTISGAEGLKLLIPAMYAASLITLCFVPRLRQRFAPLVVIGASTILGLAVVDRLKAPHYLVYTLPALAAVVAVVAWELDPKRRLAAGVAVVLIGLQAFAAARVIVRSPYQREYTPVVEWIRANADGKALVMADSAFFFDLGPDRLLDDVRLGYLTGKRPEIVVVNDHYLDFFGFLKRREPDTWKHIQSFLENDCSAVRLGARYTIYVRKRTSGS